ncbi:hypothetical protein MTO96_029877 [Rhipicephalus appendiculatus]
MKCSARIPPRTQANRRRPTSALYSTDTQHQHARLNHEFEPSCLEEFNTDHRANRFRVRNIDAERGKADVTSDVCVVVSDCTFNEGDDDFKPTDAPPSKRPKPAVKEVPKKAEKKTKPDGGADTSSSAVSQKQKTGRASLDEKLFQRDLEAALRLSQNGPAPEGQRQQTGSEGKPADSISEQNDIATFPETLELAGEVVVQSEPAPDNGKPSASPAAGGEEEEDYQPEQEESSEGEEDEEDASDEDFSGSDDDKEFAPSKAKASRSRKEPVEKKPPAAPKKAAGE